jgi:hypothetical protein
MERSSKGLSRTLIILGKSVRQDAPCYRVSFMLKHFQVYMTCKPSLVRPAAQLTHCVAFASDHDATIVDEL